MNISSDNRVVPVTKRQSWSKFAQIEWYREFKLVSIVIDRGGLFFIYFIGGMTNDKKYFSV